MKVYMLEKLDNRGMKLFYEVEKENIHLKFSS